MDSKQNGKIIYSSTLPFQTRLCKHKTGWKGLKKVLSSCPGQADLLTKQITFHYNLSMGKVQASSLSTKSINQSVGQSVSQSYFIKGNTYLLYN